MAICYLGVGTNLGNKRKNINLSIKKINALKETKVLKVSKLIETKPVGGPVSQGKFLNAAIKIKTKFPPAILLQKLKIIEIELGRKKTVRWGPRVIDLDILLYDDLVLNSKELCIPHPRMLEREFVLKPLLEII
ncbi:MAG: 2-amino-4-hydroxy-6-hydroxymethyldihydropteridine diphosphokinase [Candidatus Omnitrophica bacterium]|nr:2-amino-4-hydroxy-6-hydroxymethyldihydropteridine diphosphokinase [Candidatus Omnitrophota bacterium]